MTTVCSSKPLIAVDIGNARIKLGLFAADCAADMPEPVEQYHFAAEYVGKGPGLRKRLAAAGLQDWRFDFTWPRDTLRHWLGGVAVEIDGGIWTQGRHTRGAGYEGDVRKLNAATRLDWKVYHVTASMLRDPQACVALVREALE